MIKYLLVLLSFIALSGITNIANASLRIFTCEPEWAALAKQLAEPGTRIDSATTGLQDPHYITARASLLAKVRRADLLICTGAGLESAWLPLLIRKAGNPDVRPGQTGYFEASQYVSLQDKPVSLSRQAGDVHPQGNPHIHLNPHNITTIAKQLQQRLTLLDPVNKQNYQQRLATFLSQWQTAIVDWEQLAKPLKTMPIVSQHASWRYLIDWLSLNELAVLEPKPGFPTSASHLARLTSQLQQTPAKAIIYAAYQDKRPATTMANNTNTIALALPYTIGGSEKVTDLFQLFDETLRLLLHANGKTK